MHLKTIIIPRMMMSLQADFLKKMKYDFDSSIEGSQFAVLRLVFMIKPQNSNLSKASTMNRIFLNLTRCLLLLCFYLIFYILLGNKRIITEQCVDFIQLSNGGNVVLQRLFRIGIWCIMTFDQNCNFKKMKHSSQHKMGFHPALKTLHKCNKVEQL
jgi:hypothetical protein